MRCPTCRGFGEILIGAARETTPTTPTYRVVDSLAEAFTIMPCPTCGGCGIASCCDGMVEVDGTVAG